MKITLNGLACAGKGTIARELAKATGIPYIDLGLVFRFSAYAIQTGVGASLTNVKTLIKSKRMQYIWDGRKAVVLLDERDITAFLYAPEIAQATARLSSVPDNLRVLSAISNTLLAGKKDVICDGRSAGTIILPRADFKFYITADETIRASRRFADLQRQGHATTLRKVLLDIRKRDQLDLKRRYDPLTIPKGSHILDTGKLTVADSVRTIRTIIGR